MCLIANHIIVKKAKEDIVCYKVVQTIGACTVTPYQNIFVTNKTLKGLKPFVASTKTPLIKLDRTISKGCIHTFKEPLHIVHFRSWRCIIPKGTLYWESKLEYASQKIVFVEEITKKEQENNDNGTKDTADNIR